MMWPGLERHGWAWLGAAWRSRASQGLARPGTTRVRGPADMKHTGPLFSGQALTGQGSPPRGRAWLDSAWLDSARQGSGDRTSTGHNCFLRGWAGHGTTWRAMAGRGSAGQCAAWHGKGRVTGHVQVTTNFSVAWRSPASQGGATQGKSWRGKGPRSGGHEAHRTVIFLALPRRCRDWLCAASRGEAGRCKTWSGMASPGAARVG
jgi:hypothetical protein